MRQVAWADVRRAFVGRTFWFLSARSHGRLLLPVSALPPGARRYLLDRLRPLPDPAREGPPAPAVRVRRARKHWFDPPGSGIMSRSRPSENLTLRRRLVLFVCLCAWQPERAAGRPPSPTSCGAKPRRARRRPVRPRAAVIDGEDRLCIVDFTARIQAFDLDGNYLGPTFTTPDFRNGRPSGLGVNRDGNLIVCDSHYHCIRIYTPDGTELKTIGGEPGTAPGQFGYVSDRSRTPTGSSTSASSA